VRKAGIARGRASTGSSGLPLQVAQGVQLRFARYPQRIMRVVAFHRRLSRCSRRSESDGAGHLSLEMSIRINDLRSCPTGRVVSETITEFPGHDGIL
jgi:hypothetical protein